MTAIPADIAHLRIINMNELSRLLGSPKSTLHLWIDKGTLPKPLKLGLRRTGWLARDIEAWLQSKQAV